MSVNLFGLPWLAVCGLVKKWSHFGTALAAWPPRWSSKQEKLATQQKLGPHAAKVKKMHDLFQVMQDHCFNFNTSSCHPLGFHSHLFIYWPIFACGVFYNSAQSAPSALVLEFNIHPTHLCLHLAAGSHISTGNGVTVLFFVIEGFLSYGGSWVEGVLGVRNVPNLSTGGHVSIPG